MKQFEYVEKVEELILIILNLFSNLLLLFRFNVKKAIKRNRSFKSANRRCFILGNGPSLKDVNLGLLKDEDCMTVNWFYKYNEGFVSKYYRAVDTEFYTGGGLQYLKTIYSKYPSVQFILKYSAFKSGAFGMEDRVHYIYTKLFQHGDYVQTNCCKNMTAGINVINQCIQVAIHLGYEEIYLLGCDFSQYASLKPSNFYSINWDNVRKSSMGSDAKWSAKVHYHHYALQQYALKHGIRIINLTPNSLIDAYPRDTIENIL